MRCQMDTGFSNSPVLQVALEAIKAKHRNLLACFATEGNSLLLELADMILLLSGQIAMLQTQRGDESQNRARLRANPANHHQIP